MQTNLNDYTNFSYNQPKYSGLLKSSGLTKGIRKKFKCDDKNTCFIKIGNPLSLINTYERRLSEEEINYNLKEKLGKLLTNNGFGESFRDRFSDSQSSTDSEIFEISQVNYDNDRIIVPSRAKTKFNFDFLTKKQQNEQTQMNQEDTGLFNSIHKKNIPNDFENYSECEKKLSRTGQNSCSTNVVNSIVYKSKGNLTRSINRDKIVDNESVQINDISITVKSNNKTVSARKTNLKSQISYKKHRRGEKWKQKLTQRSQTCKQSLKSFEKHFSISENREIKSERQIDIIKSTSDAFFVENDNHTKEIQCNRKPPKDFKKLSTEKLILESLEKNKDSITYFKELDTDGKLKTRKQYSQVKKSFYQQELTIKDFLQRKIPTIFYDIKKYILLYHDFYVKTKYLQMIATLYPGAYKLYWAFPNIMLNKKFKIFPNERIATCKIDQFYSELNEINWKHRQFDFERRFYNQILYSYRTFQKFSENGTQITLQLREFDCKFNKRNMLKIKRARLPIKFLKSEQANTKYMQLNYECTPVKNTNLCKRRESFDRTINCNKQECNIPNIKDRLKKICESKIKENEYWCKINKKYKHDINNRLVLSKQLEILEKIKFMFVCARKSRLFLHQVIEKLKSCDQFYDGEFYTKCLHKIHEMVPDFIDIYQFDPDINNTSLDKVHIIKLITSSSFVQCKHKLARLIDQEYNQLS